MIEPVPQDGDEAMSRVELLSIEEMTEEQRRIYEAVARGPRGRMVGPLRAAIHSPALARLWSDFGEHLRYKTSLPTRIVELAILVTARRWTSQVAWWAHAPIAEGAGLERTVIDAIQRLEPPKFEEAAEAEIYEFARYLSQDGFVTDEVYDPVKARWETLGVVELTAVIGYYSMVAMTLNAHRIPPPDGGSPLAPATRRLPAAVLARGV